MRNAESTQYLNKITDRSLENGGFEAQYGSGYRPDATAWAILVLNAYQTNLGLVGPARLRLSKDQFPDGRVSIALEHPDSWWPTSLAILAWNNSSPFQTSLDRSAQFLLNTTGVHWKNENNSILGHDPSILGWSWIEHTHSWNQPTAFAMIALTASGYGSHARIQEGQRMLMNRQLPHGGWNYGNTMAFGQELRPSPESTGIALTVLAMTGKVSHTEVEKSLKYLSEEIPKLRTPLSLGWGLLGLSAWGIRPTLAKEWITESFTREARYGGYDTPSLCVLLLALLTIEGIETVWGYQA